jgi:hypothetical protein
MASARALVKALLGELPGVSAEHRAECLRHVALYKMTEAECKNKYRTRFMSAAAWEIAKHENKPNDSKLLIHEHVNERAKTCEKLLKPSANIDEILNTVVACVVTKDEHNDLRKKGKHLEGWERYKAAQIRVWDTENGSEYIYPNAPRG